MGSKQRASSADTVGNWQHALSGVRLMESAVTADHTNVICDSTLRPVAALGPQFF